MNRMLRITTFLAALVALAIAAPLAQADPPQLQQQATNGRTVPLDGWAPFALSGGYDAVARDGHLPSNAATQLPNFNIYGAETATLAPASDSRDGWQGKYIVGGEVVTAGQQDANPLPNFNIYGAESAVTGSTSSSTHPDNRSRFVPADTTVQTRAPQSGSEINWSDAGYGFGAGLLLAVLIGGAVVMSGRAGRGLAHS